MQDKEFKVDRGEPDVPVWREIRHLARLAFPIVISLAAATLIGVVDTIMIAPLGTNELAAAAIATAFLIVFYSGLYGFVSVAGVRMASAYGGNDPEALAMATRAGLIVAGATGVLGAALMLLGWFALDLIGQPPEVTAILGGYWITMSLLLIPYTLFYTLKALFDAMDAPWIGVALAFLAVALNVPANLVLIHGIGTWEGWGLLGAGLASLLSESVSFVLAWILLHRMARMAPARRWGPVSPAEIWLQLREGTTVALGYVGEGGAYAVAGLMMGWFSATALAAHQIVSSVSGVLYMVPMGIAIAVSLRVGQAIGSGKRQRLIRIGQAALMVVTAWMSLVILAILLGGAALSEALAPDPEVVALASSMFLVVAAMQIADGVQGSMIGAARGMMDNRIPVVITLIAYWVVALPLGYVLGFYAGVGPNGVWIGYGVGLALAAGLLTLRYFRLARVH